MADINEIAVNAAKVRVEALVPGAKIKSIVRINLAYTPAHRLQVHGEKLEMRRVKGSRSQGNDRVGR